MPKRRHERDDELDEDTLQTMYDQPPLGWSDDEDDSDNDSTQLAWVSPLDPRFGDGKPPERFPADEPLTPPRRLAPDVATPVRPPPEPAEAEQTDLRESFPRPPLGDDDVRLVSAELDPGDLEPEAPAAAPAASTRPKPPPRARPARTPTLRRTVADRPPSHSGDRELPTAAEARRVAGLVGMGLVVGVLAALLVLALAATWWLAAAG